MRDWGQGIEYGDLIRVEVPSRLTPLHGRLRLASHRKTNFSWILGVDSGGRGKLVRQVLFDESLGRLIK